MGSSSRWGFGAACQIIKGQQILLIIASKSIAGVHGGFYED